MSVSSRKTKKSGKQLKNEKRREHQEIQMKKQDNKVEIGHGTNNMVCVFWFKTMAYARVSVQVTGFRVQGFQVLRCSRFSGLGFRCLGLRV